MSKIFGEAMKELENVEEKIISGVSFDDFWCVYPRKTNKPKAMTAFERLSEKDKFNAIQGAQHHAKCNPQWRNPTLVPHATTFLNGKRWLDEIVEERNAQARVHGSVTTGPAMIVWKAMTQMFGKQWIDRHGESPMPVWVTQLSKLPDEKIRKGLRECADSGAEFPPSLPSFLAMCRRQSETLPEFKSLPRPWPEEGVANSGFTELRKILKYREPCDEG